MQWAERGEWEPLQQAFYAAHFEPVTDGLDLPDDAFEVLPDEGAGMLRVFVLEEFFTARFGEHGELNVVDDYLKRRGWRESVPQPASAHHDEQTLLGVGRRVLLRRLRRDTRRPPHPPFRIATLLSAEGRQFFELDGESYRLREAKEQAAKRSRARSRRNAKSRASRGTRP